MKLAASGDGLDATVRDFVAGQKLFNRYTLKRILGRGGMGVVWLASDDVLERDVALKFLPELIILDRAMLGDLKRETKRSLELTHKNIVRIYDFVHDETSACISMEYIDGDTLSNLRADRPKKAFETHELTDWMKQLCDALDYAHNHAHVVHRDLKPSNLMLKRQGELKVADFGIARSLSDSVSMLTMGARGTSGTLVYMSPQQLDGERGSQLDDVYSMGATMYELLTSKPPFYSGNIDRQIRERIPPPMNNRRVELEIEGEPIDPVWEEVVAACLQKDPALRPQSALEVIALLTASPPKTSRRTTGWFAFPSRKTDQETGLRPAPPSTKTRPKTEVRPKPVREKKFRLAVARTIAAGNDKLRGAALGTISAIKAAFRGARRTIAAAGTLVFRAGSAVGAATANILLAAGHGFLIITKETVRGTVVVAIPAAAAAGVIWYIAIRPPPPKKIVAQPPPKIEPAQPPKTQPVSSPTEPHLALVEPMRSPSTGTPPESKPSPPAEGGLSVDTAPPGAVVIVDGSITKTSPANLSNLAVGKHHVQIVLEGYMTEEQEVEVKEGQITSQGVVTLQAREQPQAVAVPSAAQETLNKTPEKTEQKVAAAKKPVRAKQPAAARTEKPAASITRQVAAAPAPAPPSKAVPKPASTPKPSAEPKRVQNPFGEGAPGG